MKRMSLLISMTIAVAGGLAGSARAHQRDHLCVGDGRGCYADLQAAVNAARDGATISIGRGTFKGGVTIDKRVELIGAGARATTISGGGPVLTIGRFGAASEPTVSIAGVTITGGRTRSARCRSRTSMTAACSRSGAGSRSRRRPTSATARP